MAPPPQVLAAAIKYGPLVDARARQYINPYTGKRLTGTQLLLKLAKGENGWDDKGVSSAGARGFTQFMPQTRESYIRQYGIDPWKNADQAFHATALYLKNDSRGLAGYNPGMPSYTDYILHQHIGPISAGAGQTATTVKPIHTAGGKTVTSKTVSIPGTPVVIQPVAQDPVALAAPRPVVTATAPAAPGFAASRYLRNAGGDIPSAGAPVPDQQATVASQVQGMASSAPALLARTAGATKTVTVQGQGAQPTGKVGRTLVVGDSLGVGTLPELKKLLGGKVDGNVLGGRPSSRGIKVLGNLLRRGGYSNVVFDLGTNDATVGDLQQSLRQLAKLTSSGINVVIPTINSPWQEAQKNHLLQVFAANHPNVTLVPWRSASHGLVGSDGIHATGQGYATRADLIAKALGYAPAQRTSGSSSTGNVRDLPGMQPHGKWGKSEGPAVWLFQRFGKPLGLSITSTKRNNTNPYSGSRSDHDYGQKQSFAIDASNGSSPTPQMDEYAYRLMQALGFKGYKKGTPINTAQGVTTINGVRYQVIYRGSGPSFGGDHTNHVHLGVRYVGG